LKLKVDSCKALLLGFNVKFDTVGLALKYEPETGLQVSPVVTMMKTTLDMGRASPLFGCTSNTSCKPDEYPRVGRGL
jgi:hypothetical protein